MLAVIAIISGIVAQNRSDAVMQGLTGQVNTLGRQIGGLRSDVQKLAEPAKADPAADPQQILAAAAAKLLQQDKKISSLESEEADAAAKLRDQEHEIAKLRTRQNWRAIPPSAARSLVTILGHLAGSSVSIRWVPGDPEAETLAQQLRTIFSDSHWRIEQFGSLGIVIGSPSAVLGLVIQIKDDSSVKRMIYTKTL